jgi:hypothetical protein
MTDTLHYRWHHQNAPVIRAEFGLVRKLHKFTQNFTKMEMNRNIVPSLPTSSLPLTAITINFQEISQLTSSKLCQIAEWI